LKLPNREKEFYKGEIEEGFYVPIRVNHPSSLAYAKELAKEVADGIGEFSGFVVNTFNEAGEIFYNIGSSVGMFDIKDSGDSTTVIEGDSVKKKSMDGGILAEVVVDKDVQTLAPRITPSGIERAEYNPEPKIDVSDTVQIKRADSAKPRIVTTAAKIEIPKEEPEPEKSPIQKGQREIDTKKGKLKQTPRKRQQRSLPGAEATQTIQEIQSKYPCYYVYDANNQPWHGYVDANQKVAYINGQKYNVRVENKVFYYRGGLFERRTYSRTVPTYVISR